MTTTKTFPIQPATNEEIAALKARGLWDDSDGPNSTRYWSQVAILDAYRAGRRDVAR